MQMLSRSKYVLPILLLLVAWYFLIFHQLEAIPLKFWDESLFALRALWMAEHGVPLSNFNQFEEVYRHINTKPPLITLLQAISFKILGYHKLALRLPIAFFVLGTVLLMAWTSRKIFKNWLPGLLGGFVLLTSLGYQKTHLARTGDHEVPLAFFTFLALVLFYQFLNSTKNARHRKFIVGTALALLAGFLTKSVMALLVLPAYLGFLFYKKQFRATFENRDTYVGMAVFIIGAGLVYGLLEALTPGFFARVWEYEWVGRYGKSIERPDLPFYYYVQNWVQKEYFYPWIWFLPLGLVLVFDKKYKTYKDFTLLLWMAGSSHLLWISLAKTKLSWYDAPVYPIIAFLVGTTLYFLYEAGLKIIKQQAVLSGAFWAVVFFGVVFYQPLWQTFERIYSPDPTISKDERQGGMMRKVERKHPSIKKYSILIPGESYGFHAAFYRYVFNNKKNYDLNVIRVTDKLKIGDKVMTCHERTLKNINNKFETDFIEGYHDCAFLKIMTLK